jgi:hypothetical protein
MAMIRKRPRAPWLAWALGVGALFSGAALLAHILAGIALPLALALTATLLAVLARVAWRRTAPAERRLLLRRAGVGVVCGVAATLAYDVAKHALSLLDPSPYNPFEAIRIFGILLTGPAAPAGLSLVAGIAFHLLNGIAFGVAFCFLFGRRGVLAGIGWGLFLELFQLTLYPGWLDIRFYEEFARVSALSHVIYGAVLGLGCRAGLRRVEATTDPQPPSLTRAP